MCVYIYRPCWNQTACLNNTGASFIISLVEGECVCTSVCICVVCACVGKHSEFTNQIS